MRFTYLKVLGIPPEILYCDNIVSFEIDRILIRWP